MAVTIDRHLLALSAAATAGQLATDMFAQVTKAEKTMQGVCKASSAGCQRKWRCADEGLWTRVTQGVA